MGSLGDEQEYAKVLYWGDFGTGKTTDMAYLAKLGQVEWLRVDKGLKPGPLRRLGLPVDNIRPHDELEPHALEEMLEGWRGTLHDEPDSIAGICLDTATELVARRIEVQADLSWRDYLAKCRKQHVEPDQSLRYNAADNTMDWYQPVTQELTRLIRHMTDLPWHVGIAAQIRRDVDKTSGHVQYGPQVNPAVRGSLIGYCDLVIETVADGQWADDAGGDVYIGYPRPRPGREGKDRFGALPRILVSPTMDRVIGYIRGELDFKTDPLQERYRETVRLRKAQEDELLWPIATISSRATRAHS
jgi:hypothetical protein